MAEYALIGAGGYIAPKHMEAVKNVDGDLTRACDVTDSVGILDAHFDDCAFFTEPEDFFRDLVENPPDFLSVCTPNFLHAEHVIQGLQICDVICEKPLVVLPSQLKTVQAVEQETGNRVNAVLQLRHVERIQKLRRKINAGPQSIRYGVDLEYITRRGPWYWQSWKSNDTCSGGLCANIGIHFFDLLIWLFGSPQHYHVRNRAQKTVEGFLALERADVEWTLSVDRRRLPDPDKPVHRKMKVVGLADGDVDLSDNFTGLHTAVYEAALNGSGFGVDDARPSLELVDCLRHHDEWEADGV